jgi:hypothetical protein
MSSISFVIGYKQSRCTREKKDKKMIIVEQEGSKEQEKRNYIIQMGSRQISGGNNPFASIARS